MARENFIITIIVFLPSVSIILSYMGLLVLAVNNTCMSLIGLYNVSCCCCRMH